MAAYASPQPLWKRNIAGILDFLLCVVLFGFLLNHFFGSTPHPPVVITTPSGTITKHELVSLSGPWTLVLIGLTIAYFLGLGRTGGTVFQRLFGMKRAR